MRFRAVFFDAGETLVHPSPSFPELFAAVVGREGLEVEPDAVVEASKIVLDRFSEVEEAVQAAGEPAAPPEEEEEEEEGLEAPAAPPTPEPTPEGPESEPAAAKEEEEDVSLEAILEDLKRREGRAE